MIDETSIKSLCKEIGMESIGWYRYTSVEHLGGPTLWRRRDEDGEITHRADSFGDYIRIYDWSDCMRPVFSGRVAPRCESSVTVSGFGTGDSVSTSTVTVGRRGRAL